MSKAVSKVSMVFLLALVLIVGVGVTGYVTRPREEQPPPPPESAGVPTWKVGNMWKLKSFVNGSWYNLTLTVVGEQELLGHNCYVLNLTYEPDTPYVVQGLHNDMKMWIDNASLRTVKLNATGEAYGFDFIYTMTYSYEIEMISGTAPWPREVGKSWTTTTNTTTKIDIVFPSIPGYLHYYNLTTTWTNITAFENVTVPAGEFKCFKMVVYNETSTGNVLSTEWYSEEAKRTVKSIDHETGDTSDLISYSLSTDAFSYLYLKIPENSN